MRAITLAVAAFATFATLTGCAGTMHVARGTVETAGEQPAHLSHKNGGYYGFLFGAVRPTGDTTNSGCQYGVKGLASDMNGWQWLAAITTYGLWTPMTVHPECAPKPLSGRPLTIGMRADDVIDALGNPTTINRTVLSSGTSEQWVYPNGLYVYIENGVVTSWQDSR